VNLADLDGP